MQSSHLSDQKCLFNVKSCFVVNDVDNNISGLLIIPSSERRTNANEQMLINLLFRRFEEARFLINSACVVLIMSHDD